MRRTWLALTLLGGAISCAGHRLPAGTPPPEYEPPSLPPWSPAAADGGATQAQVAPEPVEDAGNELSLDAGAR